MWHPAGSMSCVLTWPPALARAEEGNAHQKNTVVRSSLPLPCVVPDRWHFPLPMRFTETVFPPMLVPGVPHRESLYVAKDGRAAGLTSMMWDAQCKITPVVGTELK